MAHFSTFVPSVLGSKANSFSSQHGFINKIFLFFKQCAVDTFEGDSRLKVKGKGKYSQPRLIRTLLISHYFPGILHWQPMLTTSLN